MDDSGVIQGQTVTVFVPVNCPGYEVAGFMIRSRFAMKKLNSMFPKL
jgi:hypothetical protein